MNAPGTVNAALPGWTTRNIFEGQSYTFTESNTEWRQIIAPKACFLMSTTTDAIIRYRPNNPGGGTAVYGVSTQGRVMFPVPGVWYIQLVVSSGGAVDRTLFLMDYAMLAGAADALAGVAGIDITSINGTTQTGVNYFGLWTSRTMAAPAVNADVDAATEVLTAADTTRRFLYIRNTSTGGQVISIGFGNNAVAGSGITLSPNEWVAFDSTTGCPTQAVNVIASAANGSVAYQVGT